MQARVNIIEGNRDAGLIFRVQHPAVGYDAQQGYFAGIIPATQKAVLGKMDGQHWRELALKDFPCQSGQWYTLKVTSRNQTIQFWIDNQLIIEITDNSYSKGFAGLRVVNSYAQFDDIEITAQ